MEEKWNIDKVEWGNLNKEKLDFIFAQSEVHLKTLLDASDKLDNKALFLLGILFAMISGLSGFFISKYICPCRNWALLLPVLLTGIGFIVTSFYVLYFCIRPREYNSLGTQPKKLISSDNYEKSFTLVKASVFKSFQKRIDISGELNKIKAKSFNKALWLTFFIPILSVGLGIFFGRMI